MPFFVYDGDRYREYQEFPDALTVADEAINGARECCDPEWPLWVEEISIWQAPAGCEQPHECGYLRFVATEVDARPAEDGDGCDYWCDYVMRPAQRRRARQMATDRDEAAPERIWLDLNTDSSEVVSDFAGHAWNLHRNSDEVEYVRADTIAALREKLEAAEAERDYYQALYETGLNLLTQEQAGQAAAWRAGYAVGWRDPSWLQTSPPADLAAAQAAHDQRVRNALLDELIGIAKEGCPFEPSQGWSQDKANAYQSGQLEAEIWFEERLRKMKEGTPNGRD